jgi:hypothetical protein
MLGAAGTLVLGRFCPNVLDEWRGEVEKEIVVYGD